ncbi:SCO2524 family protein [Longispora albida]|uniref:SCO2524 family protein n=1 Tax=Longispora albida TaxID=203523 RepID=UPI000372942F|nr:SCO2524 family protein [Longispora albida]
MRIQPRQNLLQIWQSVSQASMTDGTWTWGGDAISDAQQLLCLLAPSTEMQAFRLSNPDLTQDEVLGKLRVLGDAIEIPHLLVRLSSDYLRRYAAPDGTPEFTGNAQLRSAGGGEPSPGQRGMDLTESYAVSVALTLAILDFARDFRQAVRRTDLRSELEVLSSLASDRLTAALVGLLRSYAVNVFNADDEFGQNLCAMLNQHGEPDRLFVEGLRRALVQPAAALRDITIGSGPPVDLTSTSMLFECGWTWGVCHEAPEVETWTSIRQPEGYAEPVPDLYFTAIALDAIVVLFSERIQLLGLLNDDQQRLARALQTRWEVTHSYWSTIASHGRMRWPLEDVPWRTTDNVESDYFTLLVASTVTHDLRRSRASDVDIARVGRVLDDLARRSRITQRATGDDPALALHSPGLTVPLETLWPHDGPDLSWTVTDMASRLLLESLRLAGLVSEPGLRSETLQLADRIWDHLTERRIASGAGAGLWDQPGRVFPQLEVEFTGPSWAHTYRVVQCLIAASQAITGNPVTSPRLADYAADLLSEAEHVFDCEVLAGGSEGPAAARQVLEAARVTLRRARDVLAYRPGTAAGLAISVLRDLDGWAAAREDLGGGY